MEDSAGGGNEGGIHGAVKPSSSPPPPTGFWELFRFADGLDYVLMVVGMVGAIGHGCSLPAFLRIMAELVNSIGSNPNDAAKMSREVVKFAFFYLIVGAIVCVFSWAEIACWTLTGERQATKMRIKFLEAALNQDIQYYDTEIRTSEAVYAMSSDVVTVQDAINTKMGNFIHYMTTFVGGFFVAFSASWKVALVTLFVSPVVLIIGIIYGSVLTKHYTNYMASVLQSGTIVEETIVQIRAVKAYVGESRALQAFSAGLKMVVKVGHKCGLVQGIGLGILLFASYGSYALLIWYGGVAVRRHYANGALVNATVSIIMMGGQALGQAAPILNEFAKARASAAKIFSVIDHVPSIDKNNDSGLELDSAKGEIEFKNVDFSYPSRPEIQILNNLSITLPKGKTVALVGSSGSGKSTVVSLIERFYDPTSGQILMDGHDIKKLKLRWLRQQIGLVSQEPTLFATSIKENILLGRSDATMAEIQEAAKVANAHSFILKLPDGYDTQVGERGTQLSGGQKQRIAIARAMLKNPAILLLDEATSALDSESERLVQEALDRFMIARTTLVIAHRLSTIQKADLVAVLQQGSLVEMGRHDELIAMGDKSVYAKLLKIQEAGHESIIHGVGRSSARSSGRNSFSSPMIAPNSTSSWGRSPLLMTAEYFYRNLHVIPPGGYSSPVLIAPASSGPGGYGYGHVPGPGHSSYSSRVSELSTPDFTIGGEKHANLQKKPSSFWRLAKMNIQEWPYALIGCIGCAVNGFVYAAFAYILGVSLNAYYEKDNALMIREISRVCYALIGIAVLGFIATLVQYTFWGIVAENLNKRTKEKVLDAVVKNEMAWFDREENESSKLSARISLDLNRIRGATGIQIASILQNSSLMLVACAASFVMQWRLTLVILSVFPFIAGSAFLQRLLIQGFSGDLEAAHAVGTQLAGEAISNLRTVAAFNSESKIVGLFVNNLRAPLKRSFWRGQIAGSTYGISQFGLFSSYGLGLWYASWLVKHGMAEFSSIIRVLMVLMVSAETAGGLLTVIPEIVKGDQAMSSMFQLLDYTTEIEPDDPTAALIPGRLRGEVEFRHVEFTYPSRPNVPVFHDLTFRAQAGKTLALVGPSGCGKSSVIAMIERFYEPSSGRLMIDGMDIRKYNLKSLRRRIALVPQEPCLFAASIYDNIAYGNESATEAEVIQAANLANAHKFISSLPDGYKTYAGERGLQLSGGQKQRIAIARAFLMKPDIMLLDEATSALDSESEREVQEALDRAYECEGKTTIVVAHRLATIRSAHLIVVINDGKVVEQGSHSQLLRKVDGIYASMVQLQAPIHGHGKTASASSSS